MSAPASSEPLWGPVDVKFDITNEAWAAAFIPSVRVATVLLKKDEVQLFRFVGTLGMDVTAETITLLTNVETELKQLLSFVEPANARLRLMSEAVFPGSIHAPEMGVPCG